MKFCMFCGKEIPDQAMFCPSCGAKLPEPETKEEPVIEQEETDEDNIALNILSKANFASQKGTGKSIIPSREPKKYEKKAVKVEADGKPVQTKKENVDELNIKFIDEKVDKTTDDYFDTPKLAKKEEGPVVPVFSNEEEPDDELDDFDKEQAEMMAMAMAAVRGNNNDYTPPILEDIKEEADKIRKQNAYEEVMAAKAKSTETIKEDLDKQTAKPVAPKPQEIQQNNQNAKPSKPLYKKRNLLNEESEEDEEDFAQQAEMKTNSTISALDGNDGLTADEKADLEKYKKYKESAEGQKDERERRGEPAEGRTVKGEGRKSNGRKKEIRKNIDKEIAERDIRDIQHEEVVKKDDVDKDYDGYYENVKPIDFDKMHDNSAVIKTSITGIVIVALACIVFYLIITFFMK